jgi:formyl-CoA transferase
LSADGQYVAIAGNGDGIFKRLMHAMGREDLENDPELANNEGRTRHSARLDEAISEWTEAHPLAHILEALNQAAVPGGRVYTAADIVADPHYEERQMIEHHSLADGQPIDVPGIVPKLSATPGRTEWLGPPLGAHTAEVLGSVGIDAAELARLRSAGIV